MSTALGIVVGLVLGLTGAGGSVFAVPLLVFGLGLGITQAAPMALIAVCAAATLGTLVAWNVSYVRYRAATLMAVSGCLTAPIGLRIASGLPERRLEGAFALVLVIVALRLVAQARRQPSEARIVRAAVAGDGGASKGPLCRVDPITGRLAWTRPCALTISAIGALTGFLSGLLGVGGGFVIVPALRAGTALSMHSAIATSLMAIALTSAATVAAMLASGRTIPWVIALPFAAGTITGMMIGRRVAPRIAGPVLQQGFAAVMVATAGVLVARLAG